MNISLTPELEQFIQSQVASGNYTSPEEVIIAGIRLLEERERIYKGCFEERLAAQQPENIYLSFE